MMCPECKNDDASMIEDITTLSDPISRFRRKLCVVCSREWKEEIKKDERTDKDPRIR